MRLRKNPRQLCRCGSDSAHSSCPNCPPGDQGPPGLSIAFVVEVEPPGVNLPNGGHKITVGGDTDLDGTPDTGIVIFYVPDGADGRAGATPTFILGTVTTLPAGSPATAAISATVNPNEYQIDFGLPQGIQGPPGPEQLLWANTAFVDSVNGNNGSAVIGDATKPYLDPQAANNALVAAGLNTSGLQGLIWIRNGSYSTSTGYTFDDWINVHMDNAKLIGTNVANPVVTFIGRSHINGFGSSIAHNVTGGKALYAASFYSGRIELNKIQGAVDINAGGSSFTMKIRDWLPTSAVNTPSGYGDLASGNCLITNAIAEIEAVNCWATIRVTDTGTGSVVKLRGYFKNGAWVEQNSNIETGNCEITRNNSAIAATIVTVNNNATIKTFATKIKGTLVTLVPISLIAAASKAYLNSTVLVSGGGASCVTGPAGSAVYNYGGVSANVAVFGTVNEVFVGTQPIFVNAAVV